MLVDGGPTVSSAADMSSDSTTTTTSTVVAATQGQDDHSLDVEITGPSGMLAVVPYQAGSPHAVGPYQAGSPSPQQQQQQQMQQQQQSAGPLVEYPYDPPDTKEGIEELCPVCGDKVSGYHYGLLTCESCKGFFKRTVQNKKVYTCVADRSCHIDKSQRKRCPFCRFQKCLDVGMKLEAVRADRMRGGRNKFGPMYKRDRARKLQMMRQKQIQRAQCLGIMGSNEVTPSLPPPFTPPALPAPSMYSNDSHHIKQELIQIPQLSSSTSSPDSSPSPLCTSAQTNSTMGSHFALAGGPPVLSTVPEPIKPVAWSSSNRAPSPPHPTGSNGGTSSASPKPPFHYGDVSPVPLTVNSPSPMLLGSGKIPHLIKELQVSMPDDKEWQTQLFGLLQNQTYNQCEVDVFELMCKVIDQSLFAQVDWARNSIFFKELKVDDQMKLLQHSWSDMLVLDHLHQRLHNGLPEEITMPNGQKFSMVNLALLGVNSMTEQLNHVSARLQELKFDPIDYICLKFLLLLNPAEVRTLSNVKLVVEAYDQTQQALVEYTLSCYPQYPDKFNNLMSILPEIHVISERGEDFLLYRHLNGSAPSQTLLMEMLHAKKK